jgi:L-threonylcarbamoyladenylate synthase
MTYTTKMLSGKDAAYEAAKLIEMGECVAIPTETVYGLAAKADNPQAVAKIFEAKKRPTDHPLIVHILNASEAKAWASDIPQDFYRLAQAFWPGPLTMILRKLPGVPYSITAGLDTIALRVPSHPLFLKVLSLVSGAMAAPSANLHKELSAVSADQVLNSMSGRISAVVDGGRCSVGVESTIIDLTSEPPRILRAGPITREQLERQLEKKIHSPVKHTVKSPGNMQAHYQPKAQLRILDRQEIRSWLSQGLRDLDCFLIHSEDIIEDIQSQAFGRPVAYRMPSNSCDYARDLYYTLARADRQGAQRIFVEGLPQTEEWLAVNDRLNRAQS